MWMFMENRCLQLYFFTGFLHVRRIAPAKSSLVVNDASRSLDEALELRST